jgi:hypothetical protein
MGIVRPEICKSLKTVRCYLTLEADTASLDSPGNKNGRVRREIVLSES